MKTKLMLAMATGLAMITTASQAEKWDMALAYSATNFHSEMAAEFAKDVTEKTDGALEIATHPSGSLFGGAEIFGAVRKGLVPMGERLISALGNEDPIYEIDALPFLATSFEDSMKLYKASKPALEKTLAKARVKLLYSCPWPPQGFYSIKEAKVPADVEGLKFRAYNATTSKIAEALGMAPTKIEAAELSQAFATGVAESMISSGATGYDRKLWEHVKYYYDVKAWLPRNMVIVNAKAWARLDDNIKTIVEEAAATAESKCWAKSAELDGWYIEQFKEQGMNVAPASDAMMEAFSKAGDELKAAWLERAGDEGAAVLKAYEGM
ncbi:TRAP-type C4-dicarboxylate transport system, substrate-binding protein [Cohaesibacter sp. ES.047]|uniref:TRAP transporter substrate-binding protein n=1 Tax=Cohaesibacter sp. ES.047 TaxID=1798205 RepID=UPI000BB728D1|nr:TRAP transporter substrate-binding protein [Cohaesibacter sp. ES.047]SNY89949.1 TRAP-type C4-dicarboxylate transport system, substrate-binding protein [Cohaesibacter sp. ES.047]